MYREFAIVSVDTSFVDKKISVLFSLEVDEETINHENIIVTEKDSGNIANYSLKVDGKIVQIVFADWPIPNTEYQLYIRRDVFSVAEDRLSVAFTAPVVFKSSITSQIVITNPSDFERLSAVDIAWDEIGVLPVGDFYLEIATDQAFYNKVVTTTVLGAKNYSTVLPDGQYYVRICAQKDGEFGCFSDTVTFIVATTTTAGGGTSDTAIDDVLLIEPTLIDKPVNGETPISFVLEFDGPILSYDKVTVIRKSV